MDEMLMIPRGDMIRGLQARFIHGGPYEDVRAFVIELRAQNVSREVLYDVLMEAKNSANPALSEATSDAIDDVLDELSDFSPEFRRIE
jgi:hypothetical protein